MRTEREPPDYSRSVIAYMASNHVAANLLMFTFLLGGFLVALSIKQETYPAFELNTIEFEMSYPGASPEEVEEGIILAVEDSLLGMAAVKRITAEAQEGETEILIELREGFEPNRALQDVKNTIDRITSFPDEAERPVISLGLENRSVITLTLYGDLDESELFDFAERVRTDLLSFPEISQIEVWGGRRPEVSIEISLAALRSLNLTLDDVAEAVRANAQDVPAGGIRTDAGEVLLRTSERRDFASEYADIPLVTTQTGAQVRLGDVAKIVEGFEDTDRYNAFNGQPGTMVSVYQNGDERPLEIAKVVTAYMKDLEKRLPPNCGVGIFWNTADDYEDRLDLLARNGGLGLFLVLIVLGMFLAPRLAFWVAMGIPVSVIGSLLFLPPLGATINMITLFGFIITLGMVVDDAIIVGENIYYKMQEGHPPLRAAVEGAQEMMVPVLFAVGTNIIAFVPLLFVPGETGKFFSALPVVVISVFILSMIESLFILPAHLSRARYAAGRQDSRSLLARLGAFQRKLAAGFEWITSHLFIPTLEKALAFRYLTVALFFCSTLLVWAWYYSGRINFTFDPLIESTRVDAEVMVPYGSPYAETKRIADHVEQAGIRAVRKIGGAEALAGRMNIIGRRASNRADVNLTLVAQEERDFTAGEFVQAWREEIGPIAGIESIYFEYEVGPSGSSAITIELAHPDREELESGAAELAGILLSYDGVKDVNDGFARGKPQIDFTITPEGRSLGLTANELGRQIRHAYYGAEALRQQRGRNEVKVMVRLTEHERRSMHELERLVIRTPEGGHIPLAQAADLELGTAYTQIDRVNGKRVLNITANVVPELVNVSKVREDLELGYLPQLMANHPGMTYSFEGRQREEREALAELRKGLTVALFAIFIAVAALFRSYVQGLIVSLCIPFSVASAVVGHIVMGYELSIVSVFGIIALTGVSVNGSLVLTVTFNEMVAAGMPLTQALVEAARRRFRPIVLTSLTTFIGLAPMILERSTQARFLVPMAISIGIGILCSSLAVLFQTTAIYCILHDVRSWLHKVGVKEGPVTAKELEA
jgi:multidrug efflux pump subunit AcrB